jgi:hypothetical protein
VLRLPDCLLCEKRVRPLEPFTLALAQAHKGDDAPVINIPVHFACFAKLLAGEISQAVLEAMRDGEVPVALERDEDEDLKDTLGRIVAHMVGRL